MFGEDERVDSNSLFLFLAAVAGVADAPAAAAAIREFWKPPCRALEMGVAWTR
jgi:hypothetical protein